MNIAYHVRPRYTPGSPAQIGRVLALRLAAEEARGYEDAISWSLHPQHQLAREQGPGWVVWTSWESQGKYHRKCLITGAVLRQGLKDPIIDPPLGDRK